MKKLTLISGLLILSASAFSQYYQITFDGGSWDNAWRITIDTSNPANIWQIGKPQKIFFDSAYSTPHAIVTDTAGNYPPSNSSVFYIEYDPYTPLWWPVLSFYYKMDSDSLADFGSIEASYDNGQTWINIITEANNYMFDWSVYKATNDSLVFDQNSTDNPFTGKSDGWYNFNSILFGWYNFPFNNTIIYRFTFQSSSTVSAKEGWLLDNFEVGETIEGINDHGWENPRSLAYPNPSGDRIRFTFPGRTPGTTEVSIVNPAGNAVKTLQLPDPVNSFDISDLPPGLYFYRLTDQGMHLSNGKFIKY